MMKKIDIAGDNHLETLRRCDGYYACPKSPDGTRLGPLVGYTGKYPATDGQQKRFVGDVYADFAKAESYPHILKFFALGLASRLETVVGLPNIDAVCGAPIGGYSLADALGLTINVKMVKAEKKVTALATQDPREKSQLVFARHSVEPGATYVVVEDVCNNFSTTNELITQIVAGRGIVLAIACFLNRSMTVGAMLESVAGEIPVISLVRLPINEWKQEDPAVVTDIAKGNVVWKPKDEWDRLMSAMQSYT